MLFVSGSKLRLVWVRLKCKNNFLEHPDMSVRLWWIWSVLCFWDHYVAEAVPFYGDNGSKLSSIKYYGAGKAKCNVPAWVCRVFTRLKGFLNFFFKHTDDHQITKHDPLPIISSFPLYFHTLIISSHWITSDPPTQKTTKRHSSSCSACLIRTPRRISRAPRPPPSAEPRSN